MLRVLTLVIFAGMLPAGVPALAAAADTGAAAAPSALSGAMTSFTWMLGTWDCDVAFAAERYSTHYRLEDRFRIDETGTAIHETYALTISGETRRGEVMFSYDPASKLWVVRSAVIATTPEEREDALGAVRTLELTSAQPYSRNMLFTGVSQLDGSDRNAVRQHLGVNAAGDRLTIEEQLRRDDAWDTLDVQRCRKE